jgi:hypothetical protein
MMTLTRRSFLVRALAATIGVAVAPLSFLRRQKGPLCLYGEHIGETITHDGTVMIMPRAVVRKCTITAARIWQQRDSDLSYNLLMCSNRAPLVDDPFYDRIETAQGSVWRRFT